MVIITKNRYKKKLIKNNDKIESSSIYRWRIKNFEKDDFKIANKIFKSRLIVGTGKYKNFKETAGAVKASGADMVTVAVRRVNILDKKKPILMDYIDPKNNLPT